MRELVLAFMACVLLLHAGGVCGSSSPVTLVELLEAAKCSGVTALNSSGVTSQIEGCPREPFAAVSDPGLIHALPLLSLVSPSILSIAHASNDLPRLLSGGHLHPLGFLGAESVGIDLTEEEDEDEYGDDAFQYSGRPLSSIHAALDDLDTFSPSSVRYLTADGGLTVAGSARMDLTGSQAKAQWLLTYDSILTRAYDDSYPRESAPGLIAAADRLAEECPQCSAWADALRVFALPDCSPWRASNTISRFAIDEDGRGRLVVPPPGYSAYILIVWSSVLHFTSAIAHDLTLHEMPVTQVLYVTMSREEAFVTFYQDLYRHEHMHYKPQVIHEKGSGTFAVVTFFAKTEDGQGTGGVLFAKRKWRKALARRFGNFMLHCSLNDAESADQEEVLRRHVSPAFNMRLLPDACDLDALSFACLQSQVLLQ